MQNGKSVGSKVANEEEKARKAAVVKKAAAPALGNMLNGIVPEAEADAFMAFACGKPRLRELVAKKKLTADDKERLRAAYAGHLEAKKQTAIVRREAAILAPLLGISEEKAGSYLEVYNPDQLKDLALVANREELEADTVIGIDMELLLDGSYFDREKETITVSNVHAALTKLMGEELKVAGTRGAVQAQDMNLDNAWEMLVKKHDGDEEKAAVEYTQVAEQLIKGAKAGSKMPQYQLAIEQVLELFKLFDYNREDIDAFLEYVQHEFALSSDDTVSSAERLVFSRLLGDFIEQNANTLSLNERSTLFKSAKARQTEALIKDGRLDKSAAVGMDAGETPDEADAEEEKAEKAAEAEQVGYLNVLAEAAEGNEDQDSGKADSEDEEED